MKLLLKLFIAAIGLMSLSIFSKTADEKKFDAIISRFEGESQISKDELHFLKDILHKKIEFLNAVIDEFNKFPNVESMNYQKAHNLITSIPHSNDAQLLMEVKTKLGDIDASDDKDDVRKKLKDPYVAKRKEYQGLLKNVDNLLQQEQKEISELFQHTEPELIQNYAITPEGEKRMEVLLEKIEEPENFSKDDALFLQHMLSHKLQFLTVLLQELHKGKIDPDLKEVAQVIKSAQDAENLQNLKQSVSNALNRKTPQTIADLISEYTAEKDQTNELLQVIKELSEEKSDADKQQQKAIEQEKIAEAKKINAAEQAAQQAAQAKKLAEEANRKKVGQEQKIAEKKQKEEAAKKAAADKARKQEQEKKTAEKQKRKSQQEQAGQKEIMIERTDKASAPVNRFKFELMNKATVPIFVTVSNDGRTLLTNTKIPRSEGSAATHGYLRFSDINTQKPTILSVRVGSGSEAKKYLINSSGKTIFLTWDKKNFPRPQTGPIWGILGKTESSLSLSNNVGKNQIRAIK